MKFLTSNAHWLLRIALASVFIYHGVLKFLNLEGFAQMLPISYLQVVLVAFASVTENGFYTADRISATSSVRTEIQQVSPAGRVASATLVTSARSGKTVTAVIRLSAWTASAA